MPDTQGRLRSETMGLLFVASAEGDRLEVFDARTGERLRYPVESEKRAAREETARRTAELRAVREAAARQEAEQRAIREETARKAVEDEFERLRGQLERLKERPR